jgi:hypothetical protein
MVARSSKASREPLEPLLFQEAWAAYPKRPGNNRQAAVEAWNARIREGASPQEMVEGVKSYARYIEATGTQPQYIKQAATFLGPKHHFRDAYDEPTKAPASEAEAELLRFYREERVV